MKFALPARYYETNFIFTTKLKIKLIINSKFKIKCELVICRNEITQNFAAYIKMHR